MLMDCHCQNVQWTVGWLMKKLLSSGQERCVIYMHNSISMKLMPYNPMVLLRSNESFFGRKTKYYKGRPMGQNIWIFGLVEQGTNRLKLFPVDNRKQTTLTQIIQANIQTGSTIYSDGWAAYKCLPTLGYQHFVVEHKHGFKAIYRYSDRSVRRSTHKSDRSSVETC